MEEVLKILQKNGVFFIATADGAAGRVRPFGFAAVHNERLYFITGKNKEVYEQLLTQPDCEICSCSLTGQWMRVRGKAVFDDNLEVKQKAFNDLPDLLKIYKDGVNDPKVAPFYLDQPEAILMDFQGNFEKLKI